MTDIIEGNRLIADAGGWVLATHFPPHVYRKGGENIDSISFHKAKLFGKLIHIVDLLEQKHDLYIIIKRKQCTIQKMHLTSNQTIIDKEGKTKQESVWLAIVESIKWYNQNK